MNDALVDLASVQAYIDKSLQQQRIVIEMLQKLALHHVCGETTMVTRMLDELVAGRIKTKTGEVY